MKTLSRPMSAANINFGARYAKTVKDYSMNPKVSVYHGDGTGRDTYINFNNGGFKKYQTTKYRRDYSTQPADMGKNATVIPKFAIYRSDGMGRDSYIYSNCGGLYQGGFLKFCNYKNYIRSLRAYDTFKLRKDNDFIYYANHYKTPKASYYDNIEHKLQRSASVRLSRPKSGFFCTRHHFNSKN